MFIAFIIIFEKGYKKGTYKLQMVCIKCVFMESKYLEKLFNLYISHTHITYTHTSTHA